MPIFLIATIAAMLWLLESGKWRSRKIFYWNDFETKVKIRLRECRLVRIEL